MSQFKPVAQELATLKAEMAADKATAAVDAAVVAGQVAPAAREWALGYAAADPAGFAAYVAATPAVITPGPALPGRPKAADAPLGEDEMAVCAALGLDAAAFKATRKED